MADEQKFELPDDVPMLFSETENGERLRSLFLSTPDTAIKIVKDLGEHPSQPNTMLDWPTRRSLLGCDNLEQIKFRVEFLLKALDPENPTSSEDARMLLYQFEHTSKNSEIPDAQDYLTQRSFTLNRDRQIWETKYEIKQILDAGTLDDDPETRTYFEQDVLFPPAHDNRWRPYFRYSRAVPTPAAPEPQQPTPAVPTPAAPQQNYCPCIIA